MKLVTANKSQMHIWKLASKDKERHTLNKVLMDIRVTKEKDKTVRKGYLVATDSYSLGRREVEVDIGVEESIKIEIPKQAIADAEKVMQKSDIAHIHDSQIVVMSVSEDENTGVDDLNRKAVIPFEVQMSLAYPEYDKLLTDMAPANPKYVKLQASMLKQVVDQLRDSDREVMVNIEIDQADKPMFFTSTQAVDGLSMTYLAMPLKPEKERE